MASSVTWTKNGEPVEIDGIKNLLTQDITSRAASTYDNVLTVNAQPGETAGNYCCSVTNAVGSASRCVEVTGKIVLIFARKNNISVPDTIVNITFVVASIDVQNL